MKRNPDDGSALILALMAAVLLALLGAGLVLLGSTEGAIAANFRASFEARYAAEAAAERALQDLLRVDAWSDVLSGAAPSSFVDGTLTPVLASGQPLDLAGLTTGLQRESDLVSSWGANNPQWRLFLYGPLSAVTGTGPVQSPAYLVRSVSFSPRGLSRSRWRGCVLAPLASGFSRGGRFNELSLAGACGSGLLHVAEHAARHAGECGQAGGVAAQHDAEVGRVVHPVRVARRHAGGGGYGT
jgi:hypothetical protein